MNPLANAVSQQRQSQSMSKDRKDIYISERLRAAIGGRSESLTTLVNMIADRYMGVVERGGSMSMRDYHAELYCNVLKEAGRPLSAREIATFPVMVEDWLSRHPEFPQGPGATAVMILKSADFASLVSLVDRMERLP